MFSFASLLFVLCIHVDIFMWIYFTVVALYHYNGILLPGISFFCVPRIIWKGIVKGEHKEENLFCYWTLLLQFYYFPIKGTKSENEYKIH